MQALSNFVLDFLNFFNFAKPLRNTIFILAGFKVHNLLLFFSFAIYPFSCIRSLLYFCTGCWEVLADVRSFDDPTVPRGTNGDRSLMHHGIVCVRACNGEQD